MYTQTNNVNIKPKSYLPEFHVSQNDVGRTLTAHLVSDEGDISIPAGATVTMAGTKPSGLGYTVTGTIDGSDVSFDTDAVMTDEPGRIVSEIRIVQGDTVIGTTNVVLSVEPNPHPDDTTDGRREPLINEITALLESITEQADRVEEYSGKVLNMTVTAHESDEVTVTKTEGEVINLDFGLPRGPQGIQGIPGEDGQDGVTPDFTIGTVETLAPGEQATATITGTEEDPVLNLGIPRGAKGDKGDTGDVSSTGYYPDLYAGGLVTDKGETDTAPYTFRASKALGYRESLNQIVGATVAWNQLIGESATSVTVQSGHKYIAKIGGAWSVAASSGSAISVTGGTDILIDLTAMFGSTIADYIYSLEQATAGAGVAWLKSHGFFTKPYYAYDTGTLKSVNPTAHVTRGINAWDEEWEIGSIDANTGANISSNMRLRAKNYINCIPNTSYYFKVDSKYNISGWYSVVCYDANKNCVGTVYPNMNTAFTTPSDAYYMRFVIPDGWAGREYTGGICINISNPTINGKYFPYEEHTYPLGDVVLRGIPKLVNNELVYDGDIYKYDGSVTRKYGVVDLGSRGWSFQAANGIFYDTLPNMKAPSTIIERKEGIISALYPVSETTTVNHSMTNKSMLRYNGNIYIRDTSYTSSADFKSAMSGVYLVYELATPTTETADGYEQYQICDPDGTESFTDYGVASGDRDVAIPVGHSTFYPEDLKGKLEDIPDIPEAPASNGTYTLKAVRSNTGVTYSWVSG